MSLKRDGIRIVMADPDLAFCQTLRPALESSEGIQVVGVAADAERLVELIEAKRPDTLLLDLSLTRSAELQSKHLAQVRTIMMLPTVEKTHIFDAFRLGARGVILKNSPSDVFVEGIHGVASGQYWLDSESLGVMVHAVRELLAVGNGGTSIRDYGLTRRELDIIAKIASGRSNKEVGEEFCISERTVKHHLTNIFSKVGVTSRLQLGLFALNHDLKSNYDSSLALQPMQTEAER